MNQKKIMIIGASSGVGREMARLYAGQGHRVAITGRRNELLQNLKNEFPHQLITACFDVTGTQNRQEVSRLIDQLGGLDLFIFNAGIGLPAPEFIPENEILTTRTNTEGFVEITAFIFSYFLKKGSGQLAFTSSVASVRGNSMAPAYSASKAFMSTYAEGLNLKARRLGKEIYVTDLRPGFLNTKPASGHGRFWVTDAGKAARQMIAAIEQKKRVAYISRRWWLIGKALSLFPFALYKRFL